MQTVTHHDNRTPAKSLTWKPDGRGDRSKILFGVPPRAPFAFLEKGETENRITGRRGPGESFPW